MKNLTQIADQLAEDQDIVGPELIKVDVQVRTGGMILPPSWLRSAPKRHTAEPSKE